MSDLFTVLDLLDAALAGSEELADEADREVAASLAASARRRRDHLSGAVLVAIAGGTGSGKSSLLNAIAGRSVASTSVRRPHTYEPLAWIPAGDQAIASLVAELGINSVVEHEDRPDLALVDLPDLDSVESSHRALVERIVPLVDAVIWLFDPVKYHDPSIHADFLASMTAYESVFVFVLNKVDRLDEAEAEAIAAHLSGILVQDGFRRADVVAVAAAPPEGEPVGFAGLEALIEHKLVEKRADRAKLVEDLLQAGRRLAADANLWSGTSDDTYAEIRSAAGEPARLTAALDAAGIEGPLRGVLTAAGGSADEIDRALLRRSELAATVAALGVACAGLMPRDPGGMP